MDPYTCLLMFGTTYNMGSFYVHHHHILSRQWSIQHRADWLQSLRSWSVQCGPWGHSKRMCCTVCLGCPHGHSLLVSRPHLWRLLAVLPTPALALFRAAQSFLGRSVPVGSCSLERGEVWLWRVDRWLVRCGRWLRGDGRWLGRDERWLKR